jgi:hypothetical protein
MGYSVLVKWEFVEFLAVSFFEESQGNKPAII